jgi:glycerol-3-phosphate dehydrogenase
VADAVEAEPAPARTQVRLVKGSHVVVPRIAGANDAYLCQSADGRVVFAIPYEERFTLVGTTEVAYAGDPAAAEIDAGEEDYLLDIMREFFAQPPLRSDIIWSYAGVRPLYEDDTAASASAVTRDYRFELSEVEGAPLLTVLGGKLTTYRRLSEAALTKLRPYFPGMKPAWTTSSPLPGGNLGNAGLAGFVKDLCRRHRGFDAAFLGRLARRYGTLVEDVLDGAEGMPGLGVPLGGGLTEREVAYLRDHEWARQPEDVLWRRTKCGLHMSEAERSAAAEAIARLL